MSAKPWFNPQRDPSSNDTASRSTSPTATTPNAASLARTTTPTPTSPAASTSQNAPAAASPNTGSQLTVGPNIRLNGAEIEQCDSIVIEGHVKATIRSTSLRISSTGTFSGDAQVEHADIEGTYSGELHAANKLVVRATGKITGTVRYGKLVVEEGGEVGGDIQPIADTGAKGASPSSAAAATPGKREGGRDLLAASTQHA